MRFVCNVDFLNVEVIKNRAGEGGGVRAWPVEATSSIASEGAAALQPALRGLCLHQHYGAHTTVNFFDKKVSAPTPSPARLMDGLAVQAVL